MKPLLDIITVTKDDFDGVAATIQSTGKLRNCSGVRQIIIDSSSEPTSVKIKDLLLNEQNVDYIWQKPSGISAAFNLGISFAKADWVWFLNGRDEVHPELDANFFLQILNSSQTEVIMFQLELMQSRTILKRPPLWELWPPLYWVSHPATLIKTQLFKAHGAFDEDFKIAMDGDLWMRLFRENVGVDMLSIPVVLYDQQGVSSTSLVDTGKEAKMIVDDNFDLLVKIWISRGIYLLSLSKDISHQEIAGNSSCEYHSYPIDKVDPGSFEMFKPCLDELAYCINELESLKNQYNSLVQSRSWKVTKPLRMITEFFNRTGVRT